MLKLKFLSLKYKIALPFVVFLLISTVVTSVLFFFLIKSSYINTYLAELTSRSIISSQLVSSELKNSTALTIEEISQKVLMNINGVSSIHLLSGNQIYPENKEVTISIPFTQCKNLQIADNSTNDIITEKGSENSFLYSYSFNPSNKTCIVITIPESVPVSRSYHLYTIILVANIGLFFLLTILAYIIGESVTKPIVKLSNVAKLIKKGNIKFTVPIDTNDEIEVLADTLDLVTKRLQDTYENLDLQIKEKTKEIENKLFAIEKSNEELDRSKKAVLNILEDVENNNKELENTKRALTSAIKTATEKKDEAEKKAFELKKFQQAVESSTDQLVITDSNGIVIYANPALEKITGFSIKETLGKKAGNKDLWGGLMPPEFYKNLWDTVKIKKLPFSDEIINKRKSGERYSSLASISPILNSEGEVVAFVASERDISDTKKKEEALAKLASIVENSSEAIVSITLDKKITSWNQAAERLFGYSAEEKLGGYCGILFTGSQSEELIFEKLLQGESIKGYKGVRITKSGEQIDVSINYSPIKDVFGNITAIGAIIRDITKETQIDRAKTEFVSLASHQLRTPLSAIKWYAEMLGDSTVNNLSPEQKEFIKQIQESNTRMVSLVNALLNVSRIDMGTFSINPEKINIFLICDSVIGELKPDIVNKKITLEKNYFTDELVMDLDPDLIRIVFQNLISNAIKYSPDSSKIIVTINKDKENLLISVKDNGYGIPEGQKEKIFSKLFRADNVVSKDVEGTGLGLYIVKSIVEQSGGKIWFESEIDKGSTFYLTIPISGMLKKSGDRRLSVKSI